MPGRMGCARAVGIEKMESGAPKWAERSEIGPEAAGPGKAAPGLEAAPSLEVPAAERFTAYLSVILVRPFLLLHGPRPHQPQRPPLELILVLLRQRGRFVGCGGLADDMDDGLGRDAFHSVPGFRFGVRDAVESVPTGRGSAGAADEFHAAFVGVEQPRLDERDGELRDVDANPVAAQLLGGVNRRAAAAEWVEHQIAGVAAGLDDALQQGDGLLRWVVKALACLRVNRIDVRPKVPHDRPWHLTNVSFQLGALILCSCSLKAALLCDRPESALRGGSNKVCPAAQGQ